MQNYFRNYQVEIKTQTWLRSAKCSWCFVFTNTFRRIYHLQYGEMDWTSRHQTNGVPRTALFCIHVKKNVKIFTSHTPPQLHTVRLCSPLNKENISWHGVPRIKPAVSGVEASHTSYMYDVQRNPPSHRSDFFSIFRNAHFVKYSRSFGISDDRWFTIVFERRRVGD